MVRVLASLPAPEEGGEEEEQEEQEQEEEEEEEDEEEEAPPPQQGQHRSNSEEEPSNEPTPATDLARVTSAAAITSDAASPGADATDPPAAEAAAVEPPPPQQSTNGENDEPETADHSMAPTTIKPVPEVLKNKSKATGLVLVEKGSPQQCVLDEDAVGALRRGEAADLTLRSHPGLGITKKHDHIKKAGEWRFIESAALHLAASGEKPVRIKVVDGCFIKLLDESLVLDVDDWKMEVGNGVIFVGHENDVDPAEELSTGTLAGGGGRDFDINKDGTISCKHEPSLVLGLRNLDDNAKKRTNKKESAPQMILVKKGSRNQCVFEASKKLRGGVTMDLILKSHPGQGVVRKFDAANTAGEWKWIPAVAVDIGGTDGEEPARVVYHKRNGFIRLDDQNLVLDIAHWKYKVGNSVNWVGHKEEYFPKQSGSLEVGDFVSCRIGRGKGSDPGSWKKGKISALFPDDGEAEVTLGDGETGSSMRGSKEETVQQETLRCNLEDIRKRMNPSDVAKEDAKKTFRPDGGRDWVINSNGTISAKHEPSLVLGIRNEVQKEKSKRMAQFLGKVVPDRAIVSRFTAPVGDSGQNWWYSGAYSKPNNKIYFAPGGSRHVLEFDPEMETTKLIGPELIDKSGRKGEFLKWGSAVAASQNNGCIYFIPCTANWVVKVDPRTGEVKAIGDAELLPELDGFKWRGACEGVDGCIYAVPLEAPHILKINPKDDSVTMFGDLTKDYGEKPWGWFGCALAPDDNIYAVPYGAKYILKIETESNGDGGGMVAPFGPDLSEHGSSQWAGAICVDSTVFGIPHSSDRVLVIKIKTKGGMEEENSGVAAFGDGGSDKPGVSQAKKEECLAVTFLSSKKNETEVGKVFLSLRDDLCVTGEEKYVSGALGSDGNIYCAPQKADQVLCISPKEMTASLVGEDLSEMDEHRFNGGAVAGRDGEMYFFHHKRHGFLRLNLPRPPKTDLVHDNADDSQRVGLINMRSKGFNSGENWWYSGVCANDGNLYFAPGGSNHVVQYCPRTDQARLIGDDLKKLKGKQDNFLKWASSCVAPNGCIYMIPCSANRVIKVDPKTETVTVIGDKDLLKSVDFKWLGVTTGADGCLYAAPFQATAVLKINPENDEVTQFGDLGHIEKRGWVGLVRGYAGDDNYLYAIPRWASQVLKIDIAKSEITLIGEEFEGDELWLGGVLGTDGKIYGIPHNSNCVLQIDPVSDSVTTLSTDLSQLGREKYESGVLGPDGQIYCSPRMAKHVLVINPASLDGGSLCEGMKIQARLRGKSRYFPGRLVRDRGGDKWDIDYDDGEREYDVHKEMIRAPVNSDDSRQVYTLPCDVTKFSKRGNRYNGGAVLGLDGAIYCFHHKSHGMLQIRPSAGLMLREQLRSDPQIIRECFETNLYFCHQLLTALALMIRAEPGNGPVIIRECLAACKHAVKLPAVTTKLLHLVEEDDVLYWPLFRWWFDDLSSFFLFIVKRDVRDKDQLRRFMQLGDDAFHKRSMQDWIRYGPLNVSNCLRSFKRPELAVKSFMRVLLNTWATDPTFEINIGLVTSDALLRQALVMVDEDEELYWPLLKRLRGLSDWMRFFLKESISDECLRTYLQIGEERPHTGKMYSWILDDPDDAIEWLNSSSPDAVKAKLEMHSSREMKYEKKGQEAAAVATGDEDGQREGLLGKMMHLSHGLSYHSSQFDHEPVGKAHHHDTLLAKPPPAVVLFVEVLSELVKLRAKRGCRGSKEEQASNTDTGKVTADKLNDKRTAPNLIMVEQGSEQQCVFEDLEDLKKGETIALILKSHPGLGLVKKFEKPVYEGGYFKFSVVAVNISVSGEEPIRVNLEDDCFLKSSDSNFAMIPENGSTEEGNHVDLLCHGSDMDSTKPPSQKTLQEGAGEWLINLDGTVPAGHDSSVVLGISATDAKSTALPLCLVEKGSPQQCIFNEVDALQKGEAVDLTLKNYPGLGVAKKYYKHKKAGENHYIESAVLNINTSGEKPIRVQIVNSFFITLPGENFAFTPLLEEVKVNQEIRFIRHSSDADPASLMSERTLSSGPREFQINDDGTISCKYEPDLVLGCRGLKTPDDDLAVDLIHKISRLENLVEQLLYEKENKEDQTISERKERVLQSVVMRRALMQTDWLQVPSNKDWIISCLHDDPDMDSAVRSTNLKAISKLFKQLSSFGDYESEHSGHDGYDHATKTNLQEVLSVAFDEILPVVFQLSDRELVKVTDFQIVNSVLDVKLTLPLSLLVILVDGIAIVSMLLCFGGATRMICTHSKPVDTPERVALCFALLGDGWLIYREANVVKSMAKMDMFNDWKNDPENQLDVFCLSSVVLISIAAMVDDSLSDKAWFHSCIALTCFFLWILLLNYIKIWSQKIATFIYSVIQILEDLYHFLIVLVLVMFMFSNVFYVLLNSANESDGDDEQPFVSVAEALLTSYRMMLGDFERGWFANENPGISSITVFFFICFTFMVMVLLLNMLIAIVSDSYDYAMIRSKQLFLRARIGLAAELVASGSARQTRADGSLIELDENYQRLDRILSWMKPYFAPRLFKVGIASQDELLEDENGDVDDEDDDDEWVGRALDQEKRTQRAVDSSRISIERNIETLQNAVSNIDSKISKLEQLFGEAIARE